MRDDTADGAPVLCVWEDYGSTAGSTAAILVAHLVMVLFLHDSL